MKQALILLSGGLDSAVAAYLYRSRGYDIKALTFSLEHPRSNMAEVECAKRVATALNVEQTIVDLSFVNNLLGNPNLIGASRLKRKDVAIPLGVEMMHLASSMFALSRFMHTIVWGIQSGDHGNKENNVRAYLEAFRKLIALRSSRILSIEAPFMMMDKTAVVSLGHDLKVPFEHTISCLAASDNPVHCGKCDSCRERMLAFKVLGLDDPALCIRGV